MKRYEQGSTDMRPDPEGLWCDYTEVQAEIERLREECAALRDEVELKSAALTGTSRSMGEEIERLRSQLAAMERGYKSFRDTAEVEFTRLRGLLREGVEYPGSTQWLQRVREALGDAAD